MLEARAAVMLEEDMATPERCLDCRSVLSIEDRAKGYDLCVACSDDEDFRRDVWDEESNAEPIDSRPS